MQRANRSIWIAVALSAYAFATTGRAAPVDLADPTPREVLVQVDENTTDYAAIGAAFGAPISAQFTSDGDGEGPVRGPRAVQPAVSGVRWDGGPFTP